MAAKQMICTRCGRPKKSKKGKMCQPCAASFSGRTYGAVQHRMESRVRGGAAASKIKKAQAKERRMTTHTEQVTQQKIEQEVHADIYNVSREDLEKKRKVIIGSSAKADDGGIICTICYVKGCRIGPMGRG